jgi:Zn-dependent protease
LAAALPLWHEALDLLPRETRQHAVISQRVLGLTRRIDAGEGKAKPEAGQAKPGKASSGAKKGGIIATLAALLLKFKTLLLLAFGQGKLLLLGLGKMGTLLSMFATVGVYWSIWSWKFALGFVLCIYVHEMGHVAALRRYGMKADAPMFVPGLGALIRLRQGLTTPRQDARIGMAGPLWGLGGAVACWGLHLATGFGLWAALAWSGALLNLLNLTPVWQLDGARGFAALTRAQRWMIAALFAGVWLATGSRWMSLPTLLAVWRAFTPAADEPDWRTFATFAGLVAALGVLTAIHVPAVAR